MKRINDFFRHRQYMKNPNFEVYDYSDEPVLKAHPHTHDFYEIYLFLSDSIEIVSGNQIYHLKKGDILLFYPNVLHYPSKLKLPNGQSYHRIVFWCSRDYFQRFVDRDPDINYMWDVASKLGSLHIRPNSGASKLLYSLFLRLIDETKQPELLSHTMITSLLGEIFVHINRIIFHSNFFPKHTPTTELFNNVLYYIHTNLNDDLSLDTLASHFFVTKGYISKIFREYMDISIHQYILSLRLEKACYMIQQGKSISIAAEQSGFPDYSSFYRSFKKNFEISPKEYQAEIETKKNPNIKKRP